MMTNNVTVDIHVMHIQHISSFLTLTSLYSEREPRMLPVIGELTNPRNVIAGTEERHDQDLGRERQG